MAQCLSQLFLEVIRLQFRLRRARTNTTPSTCQLAQFITTSVGPIKVPLLSLVFFRFPKVRLSIDHRCHISVSNLNDAAERSQTSTSGFRKFQRQLQHSTIAKILENLRPGMTCPEVVCCSDDYFRRVIYSIGPYIADYPEQALLACIVQGWCPR